MFSGACFKVSAFHGCLRDPLCISMADLHLLVFLGVPEHIVHAILSFYFVFRGKVGYLLAGGEEVGDNWVVGGSHVHFLLIF